MFTKLYISIFISKPLFKQLENQEKVLQKKNTQLQSLSPIHIE